MSKAVLISIQPKWCELISCGKKTVEVRKTRPKLETPFNVYIYCSANKNGVKDLLEIHGTDGKIRKANCKVIGEFVCNCITALKADNIIQAYYNNTQETCLSDEEIKAYANGKKLYYWHISDLVIYEKPKVLENFRTLCRYRNDDGSCQYEKCECDCVKFDFNPDYSVNFAECLDYLSRPPQSWCYVEEA